MNLKSRVLGATVLWKRLNTETDPKVSLGPFPSFFSRIIGNPLKTKKCRGISEYFGSVSAIFTFDSFPVFWVRFLFFLGQFPVFRKVLNSQFVDRFPLFLGPFPLFLGPFPHFVGSFPVFKKVSSFPCFLGFKSFKFSIC